MQVLRSIECADNQPYYNNYCVLILDDGEVCDTQCSCSASTSEVDSEVCSLLLMWNFILHTFMHRRMKFQALMKTSKVKLLISGSSYVQMIYNQQKSQLLQLWWYSWFS